MKIYCDGTNSDRGTICVVFEDVIADKTEAHYISEYRDVKSHNESEWVALYFAIRFAYEHFYERHPQIFVDSQLVQRQYTGEYRIKSKHLKEWYKKVMQFITKNKIKPVVEWVPREENLAGIVLEQMKKGKTVYAQEVEFYND